TPQRPETEGGGDHCAHEARIEGVAGQRHAVDRQDRAAAIGLAARARPEANQAEVAGATAEVADEDELVVIEAPFVLRSRRDRLILERNVAEPGARRGGAQTREGDVVAGGVDLAGAADDEMHWPPDEHAAAAAIELRRRRLAQRGEDDSDQILE